MKSDIKIAAAVATISLILITAFIRYAPTVLAETMADEATYLSAVDAVLSGQSPYRIYGYLYPPTLALSGAALRHVINAQGLKIALRIINILLGALAVFISITHFEKMNRHRLLIAWLLFLLWPPLVSGVTVGNISPLISGMTLAAVFLFSKKPIPAGLLLASAVAIKPTGSAALVIMPIFCFKAGISKKQILLSLGAMFSVGILCLLWGAPYLKEMLTSVHAQKQALGNVSLYRCCSLLGLNVSPLTFLVLATVGGGAFAWRTDSHPRLMLCAAACFSLLSMPVVWQHTLLLALPIQAYALETALKRFFYTRSSKRLLETITVLAGVLIITFAEDWGGFTMLPPQAQALLLSIPLLAPLGLLLYLQQTHTTSD